MEKRDHRKEAVEKSKTHWEMNVERSVFKKTNPFNQLDNWEAKKTTQWPRTHVKVNECDT
jgi:hypothetical protein